MEGILYLKNGIIKSWNKYYAIFNDQDQTLVLLKKSFKGKPSLSISFEADVKGKVQVKVYPMSTNQTDFLVIYLQSKKLRFRAESPFKRYQWLQVLNSFTNNLTDDLRIIDFPLINGKLLKKGLETNSASVDQRRHSLSSNTTFYVGSNLRELDQKCIDLMQHQELMAKQFMLLQAEIEKQCQANTDQSQTNQLKHCLGELKKTMDQSKEEFD